MVLIRPAEEHEAPDVVRLWRAGWTGDHLEHVPAELLAERTEAYFVEEVDGMIGSTLVAVDENTGTLLGVALVDGEELCQLAVVSTARRRGIGAELVSAAEVLIAVAHERAELGVAPGNAVARRLYERCGWTDLGEVIMTVERRRSSGEPIKVPVHHYVKQLR